MASWAWTHWGKIVYINVSKGTNAGGTIGLHVVLSLRLARRDRCLRSSDNTAGMTCMFTGFEKINGGKQTLQHRVGMLSGRTSCKISPCTLPPVSQLQIPPPLQSPGQLVLPRGGGLEAMGTWLLYSWQEVPSMWVHSCRGGACRDQAQTTGGHCDSAGCMPTGACPISFATVFFLVGVAHLCASSGEMKMHCHRNKPAQSLHGAEVLRAVKHGLEGGGVTARPFQAVHEVSRGSVNMAHRQRPETPEHPHGRDCASRLSSSSSSRCVQPATRSTLCVTA